MLLSWIKVHYLHCAKYSKTYPRRKIEFIFFSSSFRGWWGGGVGISGAVVENETLCHRDDEFDFEKRRLFNNFAECMYNTKKERALYQRRNIKCETQLG